MAEPPAIVKKPPSLLGTGPRGLPQPGHAAIFPGTKLRHFEQIIVLMQSSKAVPQQRVCPMLSPQSGTAKAHFMLCTA